MNTSYLYLVAEQLYQNTRAHALCNRSWLFAIYKSLLVANRGDAEEILWTKYNEWKIDHNCRAARSTAKANKIKLISFDLHTISSDTCVIKVVIEKDLKLITKEVSYRKSAFPAGLWQVANPKNETVLFNAFERDNLYEASLTLYYPKEEVKTETRPAQKAKLDISLYADIE